MAFAAKARMHGSKRLCPAESQGWVRMRAGLAVVVALSGGAAAIALLIAIAACLRAEQAKTWRLGASLARRQLPG